MVFLDREIIREVSPDMGGLVSEEELERLGVRNYARLEIPLRALRGISALRDIADLLRGLATCLEVQSRRTDKSEKERILLAMHEVNSTNRKIKDYTTDSGRESK